MRKHVCDYCIARAVGTVCRHGRNPRGIMTLSGFLASSCIKFITVIEPRVAACRAFKQQHLDTKSIQKINIITGCAEQELPKMSGEFDLIFTSPPYFNCERYPFTSGDAAQAWQTFTSAEDFNSGFIVPFLYESARLLSKNGILALNIDDSVAHSGLCDFVLQYSQTIELHLVGTIGLRKATNTCEPIFIFCRSDNVAWAKSKLFVSISGPDSGVPQIEQHGEITVVRDDKIEGGTKHRGISAYVHSHMQNKYEFVYDSPRTGYAQLALALACKDLGRKATIFVPHAPVKGLHPLTAEAQRLGANIKPIRVASFNNLRPLAKRYCDENSNRHLLPFGADDPAVISAITKAAISINMHPPPTEIWTVISSGVLSRALQAAWPQARVYGISVGHATDERQRGRAVLIDSGYKKFGNECRIKDRPPFPSSLTYDAKAWKIVKERAAAGAVFWNVGS